MTETKTITQKNLHIIPRNELHRHPGGIIFQSDFNTDYRGNDNLKGSTFASRIESDFRWEEKLMRKKGKERYKW